MSNNRMRITLDVVIEYDKDLEGLPALPSCELLQAGLSNIMDAVNKSKKNKGAKAVGIAPGMKYNFRLDRRR